MKHTFCSMPLYIGYYIKEHMCTQPCKTRYACMTANSTQNM